MRKFYLIIINGIIFDHIILETVFEAVESGYISTDNKMQPLQHESTWVLMR